VSLELPTFGLASQITYFTNAMSLMYRHY